MGRAIGSVIVGYLVMAVVVFLTFSLAYLVLGSDGSFRPGTYELSAAWIVASIVLSFIAAILGGLACAALARASTPPKVLAAIVLILGLVSAMPVLTRSGDDVATERPAEVSMTQAMQEAEQPVWIALLNPLIGAVGVLVGARLKRS
jgi:hypothetical protein